MAAGGALGIHHDPLNRRPISVAVLLYSLWSSLRFQHLMPWIMKWPNFSVCGGVQDRHVRDLLYRKLPLLHHGLSTGQDCTIVALDEQK